MIERYENDQIKAIFSQQAKFAYWEKIELIYLQHLLNEMSGEGINPSYLKSSDTFVGNSRPNIASIKKYEKETRHEFVSFLIDLENRLVDQKYKANLHHGLTSSDIIDTASVLQLKDAYNVLSQLIGNLYQSISTLLDSLGDVSTVGRTHGRHAETIEFRERVYNFLQEIIYCKNELQQAFSALPGMISGPVGNNSQLNVSAAQAALSQLKLEPSGASSQSLPRYLFAKPIWALSLLMTCYERFATLIRLSSINEINELQEPFSEKQCGSSAMPHKRNPIIAENLCGLARMARSYINVSMENINLWWERDISHSSTERIIWPDAFHLATTATERMTYLLANLQVNKETILNNLNKSRITSHEELSSNSLDQSRFDRYYILKEKHKEI